MIAFLPEPSPGWPNAAGPLPSAPAATAEGTGLDFAGLLGAAFAPVAPGPLPEGGARVAKQGETALPAVPAASSTFSTNAVATNALAQTPETGLPVPQPTGKIVPDKGAPLPPAVLAAVPAEVAASPAAPAAARSLPHGEALLANPIAADDLPVIALGAPPAITPSDSADEAAALPAPGSDPASTAQPQAEDAAATADAPPADSGLLAALVPLAVLPPVPPPVPARLQRAGLPSPADRTIAPMPARITLPSAGGSASQVEDAPEVQTTSPSASPLMHLSASDSASQPVQPATTIAAAPPTPATPAPDRIDAPRPPAPQQETAIAQAGDLREALRSARPEMTLRHSEFGFVSLRIEQPAPEQWRAVLASRDPGFVPAIQAALAERAVAAAAASADTGQFMGQNGTSDQRYGASPNGGQAGLSPYMGQSGGRDGEAAPDHRRPSTAAALAARGPDGEADGPGSETRGLFA